MPDPLEILTALLVAAAVAALVVPLGNWCRRRWSSAPLASVGLLSLVAGLAAGCGVLGLWPDWPPREDQERLLLVLVPAAVAVELWAAIRAGGFWSIWLPRAALAAAVVPTVLFGSTYLSEAAGPGTRQWSAATVFGVCAGLAALIFLVRVALSAMARRGAEFLPPVALALVSGGTALGIMLSGYATGGLLGLPLAAALGGALGSAALLRKRFAADGMAGAAWIVLAGLLVSGRFFGELTSARALALGLAPLGLAAMRLPRVAGWPRWVRGALALGLVMVPVGWAVLGAQRQFAANSGPAATSQQPGLEDYFQFSPTKAAPPTEE